MAKIIKKKRGRKPGPKKRVPAADNDLYEIEVNPPSRGRPMSEALMGVLHRIDRTLVHVKFGQAFIIPSKNRGTIKKHLQITYPAFKFAFHAIRGNDSQVRVYKLDYKKSDK